MTQVITAEEAYEILGIPHEYREILRSGDHFQLEKWGKYGNSKNINKWINESPELAELRKGFLRYHILHTAGIFTWKNASKYNI